MSDNDGAPGSPAQGSGTGTNVCWETRPGGVLPTDEYGDRRYAKRLRRRRAGDGSETRLAFGGLLASPDIPGIVVLLGTWKNKPVRVVARADPVGMLRDRQSEDIVVIVHDFVPLPRAEPATGLELRW